MIRAHERRRRGRGPRARHPAQPLPDQPAAAGPRGPGRPRGRLVALRPARARRGARAAGRVDDGGADGRRLAVAAVAVEDGDVAWLFPAAAVGSGRTRFTRWCGTTDALRRTRSIRPHARRLPADRRRSRPRPSGGVRRRGLSRPCSPPASGPPARPRRRARHRPGRLREGAKSYG